VSWWDFQRQRPPVSSGGHSEAVSAVSNFAPGEPGWWVIWQKRRCNRREFDSHAHGIAPARERRIDEKFIIAEAPIGSLDFVLGGIELAFGAGKDAGVRAGLIPDAGEFELADLFAVHVGDVNFGPLIGEGIIELSAK